MSRHHTKIHHKTLGGFAVMAALSLVFVAASNPIYAALRGPITENTPKVPLTDGIYVSEKAPDDSGFSSKVTMTVEDGIITSCNWDAFDAQGVGKQQLSMEGKYVMTEDGPTWKAQADALAAYVIEHQNIDNLADESGYATDAIASVSINVFDFVNCVEDCLEQAAQ